MKRRIVLALALSLSASVGSAQGVEEREIGEAVVTGSRDSVDARYLPFCVTQIAHRQIEERLSASVLDVVGEQTPGLFFTDRGVLGYGVSTGGSGSLNIRGIGGSPTTGVQILMDGQPQYVGIMGHPVADVYQDFLAERVEVLRGPAGVLYGSNAMGGVVNIVTRKQPTNGADTRVRLAAGSYGTLTTSLVNRLKHNRFSSVAAVAYNRTDNHRPRMGFDEVSAYGKATYAFSENWKAEGSLNIVHFNSQNPGTLTAPKFDNKQHITRGFALVSVRNDYGRTQGAVNAFWNWGRHKINDGYSEGESPKAYLFRSTDHIAGVNAYQTLRLFERTHITLGFDYQHIGGHAWNAYADRDAELVDTAMNEVAAYVDVRQGLFDWLTADAGLRIDHHSTAGTEVIPQVGLAFSLPRNIQLKATVGKGFRNPTLMNLFMFRAKNPDLKAERIWNYELALAGKLIDGRLRYGLNAYLLKGDNLIQTVSGQNQNTGQVENMGVEASLAYSIDAHWSASANYSFISKKYAIVAVPRHKFYADATYRTERLALTVSGEWVGRLTTSTSPEAHNSYFLLNARGSYNVLSWLKVFAKGENLLAQRYEINAGFPMPKATFMGGIQIDF